jgi:signal transduction histidine kinase/CheY-like chemotaxis protein
VIRRYIEFFILLSVCSLFFLNDAQSATPSTLELVQADQIDTDQNPRSNFWRQVRDGMPGKVSLPDHEKGVLIRPGGNDWLSTRSNVVANYGRQVIAVGLVLSLVFLFFTGRIQVLSRPVGWAIDRLLPLNKPAHIVAACCFVLLGTTGLNILYGKRLLGPLFGREIFAELSYYGKIIHNQTSWLFMAAIAIVMVLRAREYLPGFVRERVSRKKAEEWLGTGGGEKILFWFAVLGTLIVAYSGATLLIPNQTPEVHQMQLFQLMHSFSALTLTGLIVGNVYIISIGIRENAQKLLEAKEILEDKVQLRTQELQNVNQQLHLEIEERQHIEDALNIAKEVAEQANLSKDKFLATASHDLLQPLTAARLMIATLRMRELRPQNQEIVEQIHQALRGTETLLTDLLDISRLGASTVAPKITNFSIQQFIKNLEGEFRPITRKNALNLRTFSTHAFVKTDNQLLTRVLRNFLSNAVRYTETGSILISARKRKNNIRVEVWDTGPGIAEDELQNIFEEFHRLENKKTGAGLGLAIVDRVSQILDHPVNVRSIVGKGSVFSIDVPIGTEIVEMPQVNKLEASDLSGVIVAIVDNDATVLSAVETYLQEWGCTVLTGVTGDELIEQLSWSSFSPDIILADFHLDAGVTGPDVVNRVRRIYGKSLPAIIISADHTEEMRISLADAGLKFLSKPVRPAKMRALIAHLVNHENHISLAARRSIGA